MTEANNPPPLAAAQLALHHAIDDAVKAYVATGISEEVANSAIGCILRDRGKDPSAGWGVAISGGEIVERTPPGFRLHEGRLYRRPTDDEIEAFMDALTSEQVNAVMAPIMKRLVPDA